MGSLEWLTWVHGASSARPTVTLRPGDEVRVWFKILEQGKERLGQFEGVVMRRRGAGASKTFTVRRISHGEGVERVFPLDAKIVSKIEVLRQGNVKRSRLYFLRRVIGKSRLTTEEVTTNAASSEGATPASPVGGDLEAAARS
jgi:large subunit ribosomal protein L19